MIRNEGDTMRRVIVVPPVTEYSNIGDLERHNFRSIPDASAAREQHDRLCRLLESFDIEVIHLPELSGHPNSVFVRDVAVVTPQGAVLMSMGLESRRGEEAWIENHLESLGLPVVARVIPPATAEGGDVILAGDIAFVGHSTRTNEVGADQVARILLNMGYRVRITDIPEPFLHIGGAMSIIAPDKVICTAGVFPKKFFQGFETITVPDSGFSSGNVITVKPNEIIVHAAGAETVELLREHSIIVHDIDLSAFLSGTGGPSCLILPVERN
jgi:dimethylargininase